MPFLEAVGVDEGFVDELWGKVSTTGSYYSISDGVTRKQFSRMLFQSNLVLRGQDIVIRVNDYKDYAEAHPIVFGTFPFRHAREIVDELHTFMKKPVCCIIPDGMKGAKHLAKRAGMAETVKTMRPLSGVSIACTVFVRR